MLRRVMMGLMISALSLALVGCGTGKAQQQDPGANPAPSSNTQQNSDTQEKAVQLTPVPSGTPLVEANQDVSKQLMAQKDVLGTQIYEQQGIVFGDITFKSGVTKEYAHNLANELLTQLKASYPSRQLTTQVVIDGKTTDSISFKP